MEFLRSRSSLTLAWTLLGMSLTGLALSIALAPNNDWLEWHLSRLGEGGTIASVTFNITLIISAVILIIMAYKLAQEIEVFHNSHAVGLRTLFVSIALCWVGLAFFPFDKFPVIHNVFGYGMFTIVSIVMLSLERLTPYFSRATYRIGYATVIASVILLISFHMFKVGSILAAELCGQLLMYIWLLSLTKDIRAYETLNK